MQFCIAKAGTGRLRNIPDLVDEGYKKQLKDTRGISL